MKPIFLLIFLLSSFGVIAACDLDDNLEIAYINGGGEISIETKHSLLILKELAQSTGINNSNGSSTCFSRRFNDGDHWYLNLLEELYLRREEFKDSNNVPIFPSVRDLDLAVAEMIFKKEYRKFRGFEDGPPNSAWELFIGILQRIYQERVEKDVSITLDGWNENSGIYDATKNSLLSRSLLLIGKGSGSLYSNLIYTRLADDNEIDKKSLKKIANFQVSSPATAISAYDRGLGDHVSSKQDNFIQKFQDGYPVVSPNVEMEIERYVVTGNISYPIYTFEKVDPIGNDFNSVYLSEVLKGKLDGEENYRSMSSIFMDKLSVLAEKITGRHCEPIDDFELKVLGTYMFHQVTGSDPKYMYLGLYDSDGKALTGDTSLYGLYSVPPTYSTNYEPDEVKPVLDLNGDYLAFNQVVYVSGQEHAENLKGRAFALIHHSDYEKLQNNKPMECGIQHYTSVRSLISHRVDNEYDPNYAYLPQGPFRGVLDVKTADEVVNVTYNGKQMGKEEDDASFCTDLSYNKDCDWGIKDSITLPGSFQVTLINGSEISVGLELPPIDFDIKLEVKGVQVERGLYEVEATFTGEDVFSRYGKFYSEVWVSDGETNTNTGKLSPEGLVNSKGSGPELGHFSCGRRAYVVPIQQLGQSSKYYRFDLMKVMDPPC